MGVCQSTKYPLTSATIAARPRRLSSSQVKWRQVKWRWKEWPIYAWGGPWGYDSAGEAQPVELEAYAAANFNLA